jgi:hypothetical protein
MLPQGKVSTVSAKRQKRSENPCTLEHNPLNMASSSGQSAQANTTTQQNKSAGRFPQGTFYFRARVSPADSDKGKQSEQSVFLIFSPGFPMEIDLLLPQQVLQRIGLRPKPPPDEPGPSTSSTEVCNHCALFVHLLVCSLPVCYMHMEGREEQEIGSGPS